MSISTLLKDPAFFDLFGLLTFTFITVISSLSLFKHKEMPRWAVIILLCIGIAGLIVDGVIVWTHFIAG